MHNQVSAGATIEPTISPSRKKQSTNCLGDQHARPLYPTIGNIQYVICHNPTMHSWIDVELFPGHWKAAINTDNVWHHLV